jgi:hypothetical protein
MKTSTILWSLGILFVSAFIFIFGVQFIQGKAVKKEMGKTNREVALTCTTDMATQFHIHPIVSIVVNGKAQQIPTQLGIQATCMTSIHTHDNSGMIHIESPQKRDFTLGDFFAVWKQPFSQNEILAYKTDATHRIRVLVNGSQVDTYENTILTDKDQITISYEPIK